MKKYAVTIQSRMTEHISVDCMANSQAEADAEISKRLEEEGFADVCGDTSGDLVDCENSVIKV